MTIQFETKLCDGRVVLVEATGVVYDGESSFGSNIPTGRYDEPVCVEKLTFVVYDEDGNKLLIKGTELTILAEEAEERLLEMYYE